MRRIVAGGISAAFMTGLACALLSWRHRQVHSSGLISKPPAKPGDVSLNSYLELALTEYLSMRAEMNHLVRLTMSLVTSAFVVAGGVAGALAANIANFHDDQRGVLLEVVAALGFAIYLTSIGFMNTFTSLEWYVTNSAREINRLASSAEQDANLASFQLRVRRFSRSNRLDDRVTWYVSYGVSYIISSAAIVLLAATALGGFILTSRSSGPLNAWGYALGVVDLVLALLVAATLLLTFRQFSKWDEVLDLKTGAGYPSATRPHQEPE